MRHLLGFAICAVVLSGCAATPFKKAEGDNGFGYSVIEVGTAGAKASVFKGNDHTKATDVETYSALGAFEYCANSNRLALAGAPDSIPGDDHRYVTLFSCLDKVHVLSGYKKIDDVPTGVQIVKTDDTNLDSPFHVDDVITQVGRQHVETGNELVSAIQDMNPGPIEIHVKRQKRDEVIHGRIDDVSAVLKSYSTDMLEFICSHVPSGTKSEACSKFTSDKKKTVSSVTPTTP